MTGRRAMLMRMAVLVEQLRGAVARRGESADEVTRALDILAQDHPVAALVESDDRLAALANVFGLDEVDQALLWAAAAPDLDTNVGLIYAGLAGAGGVAGCTVAIALEMARISAGSAASFDRLGPTAPLHRHGLLRAVGPGPWGQRRLEVAEPVLATLAGATPDDPLLASLRAQSVPLPLPGADQVAAAVQDGVRLVWIRSERGAAGASLAAGALDSLGVDASTIDLLRLGAEVAVVDVVAAAVRDAALRGCALILTHADVLAERASAAAFAALDRSPVPVLAVAARAWNASWLARLPLLVEAARLDVEQRAQLWRANLGPIAAQDGDLRQTLLALRMNPESIAEAARYTRMSAAVRREPVSAAIVREAARRVSGSGGSGDGFRTPGPAPGDADSRLGFEDLVLPSSVAASVRQLVNWARHRDEVGAHGLLRSSGRGIAALFAGNPGTGKTLAANVVAQELSMDLYQVELSSVVDKYIGETEKNLERVFAAAEALDVVLFFDEADALFGSRSEVRDARDRYANQEIAYLLQRMEHFDGITILATNLRGNLDRAFSRRMSFIITFPDPDAATRQRLWEHHLAQLDELDPADPVGVQYLAETAELSGGDIRNIVRAAAYDATTVREPIGMRHVTAATLNEYRKLGRVLPEHAFAAPQASVTDRRR